MIHTANEFTKTHHRHLLSNFAAGLHPLPAGTTVEPVAMPQHSTRRATAQAQRAATTGPATRGGNGGELATSGGSASTSTSPSSSPRFAAQSPRAQQSERREAGTGAARWPQQQQAAAAVDMSDALQHSQSNGSLIDMNPLLRNRSEALMVRLEKRSSGEIR